MFRRSPSLLCSIALFSLFLFCTTSSAQQMAHPLSARGAVSSASLRNRLKANATTSAAAAGSVCSRFSPGAAVMDPPVLQSANGLLELTLSLNTDTDAQGLTRYCYLSGSGAQAPTLVVNPGDTLLIHFTNNLPAGSMSAMTMDPCQGMMGDNMTNLHFHGTDVAPVCGQDETMHTLIAPGQSFDYKLKIPAQEAPGLYWYHPHPHGASEAQVQGGATGAIIVQGLQNVYPDLAGMPTRTLMLRDQLLPSTVSGNNQPAWDLSLNSVPVTYPAYSPAVMSTPPGEKELWRVANTGADVILNLQYVVNGIPQAMHVYAVDGYPMIGGGSALSQTSVQLGPGARAEFVVTTPNVGDTAQLTTVYQNTGPDGDYDPSRPIANVVASSSATAPAAVPATSGTPNMTLLQDLSKRQANAKRNLYFSEVLQNPSDPASPTNFYITVDGQTPALFNMDQAPNIIVHAGTVEDWTIQNRAGEDHIFHIHQLHFQILAIDGVAVQDTRLWDTYDVPYWSGTGPYHSITVRMDFSDPTLVGTFMYHCHILEHEDGGMMGSIQVLPTGSAATASAAISTASPVPGQNVTLSAQVLDTATKQPLPTGSVQFQINGQNLGTPAPITNGTAAASVAVNGNAGANTLTALYEGDGTYDAVTSSAVPISLAPFAMTSSGVTATVGSAAIASVAVTIAQNYSVPITLTCSLPATLKESACFLDPPTLSSSGTVQLTVNSTPAHPLNGRAQQKPLLFGGGSLSLAALWLCCFRRRARSAVLTLLLPLAAVVWIAGCSSGTGTTQNADAGTTRGSYNVTVTATGGTGASQYQSTFQVPVTLQ